MKVRSSVKAICNKCKIIKSEIEDSVIMEECEIIGAGRISESLIGRGAKITESDGLPKAHSFILGDNSEVII